MNWVIARLRENSTWRGIVWLMTSPVCRCGPTRPKPSLRSGWPSPACSACLPRISPKMSTSNPPHRCALAASLVHFAIEAAVQYLRRRAE